MQDKYNEILKIFYKIQQSKPDDKLNEIEKKRSSMNSILQYTISKDKEMKKTSARVNKAMRETVDIDGLPEKIFGKYLKFVQTKAQSPGPHINIPVAAYKQIPITPINAPTISTFNPQDEYEQSNALKTDLGQMIDPKNDDRGERIAGSSIP